MMRCSVCDSEVDVKYRCPGCERRTCRLECVKKHKEQFGCTGLKPIPSAPEATEPGEKYSEELFIRDYGFLESVNDQISKLENENPKKKNEPRDKVAAEKLAQFKKIQKVSKLAELRVLPTGFTRSNVNRTHFIERNSVEETEEDAAIEQPEKKTSRMARIAWTLDFIEYDSCKIIETVFDIPDDTKLQDLIDKTLSKAVDSVYLKNETRNVKEATGKWREIGKEEWTKSIAQILIGGRCFEYPQLGICFAPLDQK